MANKIKSAYPFPPLRAKNIHGIEVSVPASAGWTHVQFRRFAGCPICNLHLQSFVARHDEIVEAGIREVVIFHSSDAKLLPYQGRFPFDVIGDPGKALYRKYGVGGSLSALLAPKAFGASLREILRRISRSSEAFQKAEFLGCPPTSSSPRTARSRRSTMERTPLTSGLSTSCWN